MAMPRSPTSPVQVSRPWVSSFGDALRGHPIRIAGVTPSPTGWNQGRRGSVSAESITLPPEGQKPVLPYYEKTPEQLRRIKDSISMTWLFKDLDPEQEVSVYRAFREIEVPAGHLVIKQGDPGSLFYVVERGNLEIFKASPDVPEEPMTSERIISNVSEEIYSPLGLGKLVQKVGPGGSFGELALMHGMTRAASVISVTPCILWALDRITFRTILMDTAFRKRKMYDQFLSTVPILRGLTQYERYKIADCLDTMVFKKGDVVIKQGDPGDRFFIVEMGNAAAIKEVQGEDGKTERRVVKLYKKGDFFGELALLYNRRRAATVVATGNPQDPTAYQGLRVVTMHREGFERIMGPLIDVLRSQVYSDAPVAAEDEIM